MDTAGPISRTVSDCAMTLEAIAGYDPKDPYTWNTPVPNYQADLSEDIRGFEGWGSQGKGLFGRGGR